jgi:hypothetical protein
MKHQRFVKASNLKRVYNRCSLSWDWSQADMLALLTNVKKGSRYNHSLAQYCIRFLMYDFIMKYKMHFQKKKIKISRHSDWKRGKTKGISVLSRNLLWVATLVRDYEQLSNEEWGSIHQDQCKGPSMKLQILRTIRMYKILLSGKPSPVVKQADGGLKYWISCICIQA